MHNTSVGGAKQYSIKYTLKPKGSMWIVVNTDSIDHLLCTVGVGPLGALTSIDLDLNYSKVSSFLHKKSSYV